MKKAGVFFFLIFSFQSMYADLWIQKANLGGIIRGASAGFSIGAKGYIGTGINFSSSPAFLKDFWEWDQATNAWTQKANFGGTARSGAVGFSIGSKGYIATGYDANIVTRDLWEYNTATNTWTQKADFGGVGRDYAVAFSINGKGYIGTGYNSVSTNYKDFWEYDPGTNNWTQKANVPGGDRSSAIGFVINGKGYIGTGYDAGPKDDFWEYNPVTGTWIQKADVPGGLRSDASGFAIGSKGYVCAGVVGSVNQKDLREYDPATNTWTQKMSLTGAAREDAVSFTIGTNGYIGTGYDPSFNRLKDFWEYTSDDTPLPVEWIDFSAAVAHASVLVKWTTASESNNDFFTLEKSANGCMFEKVLIIDGNGSTTKVREYSAMDEHPYNNISYYRLRQTDFNGKCTYSKTVSVHVTGESLPYEIYPNPFKEKINIQLKEPGNYTIQLHDLAGKRVYSENLFVKNEIPFALSLPQLPHGTYLISISNGTVLHSQKIIRLKL